MKQSEQSKLIELIREIVRAEISNTFATILREMISPDAVVRTKSKIPPVISEAVPKKRVPIKNTVRNNEKKYVSNPVLNEILNNTTPFSGDAMYNEAADIDMGHDQANPGVLLDIGNNPVPINNEAVAVVAENITKDYSALMKAIDKKKGIK